MITSVANIASELRTAIKKLTGRGVRKLLLVVGCWLLVVGTVTFGQTNYYSKSTGTLNLVGTWGRNPDGSGASPANFTTANRIFNIRNNAAPTIGGDWTVSGAGSKVIIGDGTNPCVFTVPNPRVLTATTDISNNSTLRITSNTGTPYSGTLTVNSGGTYEHAIDGGTVPNATWNASSNCKITGITGNVSGGLSQSFGNFTWNCTGQTGTDININPLEVGNGGAVRGDFTLISTGAGSIRLSNNANRVLNISGNFNISGGTFHLAIAGGSANVNIGGDFNMTGGTLTETGTSKGLFIFNKGGTTQNFRRTVGTISNNIGFTVNSTVTLDFGTSDYANGGGIFTLSPGATLQTANPLGVNGSILTTSRSLSTSANYTFDGIAAQVTGTYLPAIVNNFTINNVTGITLTNSLTAASTLYMNSGNINTGANIFILSNPVSSALNYTAGIIAGRFERFINTTLVNYFFPVGTNAQIQSLTANFVNLTAGSMLVQYIAGDPGNSGLPLTDGDGSQITNQFTTGYWSALAKNSLASTNYNIGLNATGFGPYIINADTRLIKRTDAGGSWSLNGAHSSAVGSVVKRTGMNGIHNAVGGSQFGIGRSGPKILTQPSDQTVCVNATASFSIIATGYPALIYQWYKAPGTLLTNDGHYGGVTTSALSITTVVIGDAGNYYCIVIDGNVSTVQSTSASLTVNPLPVATASNNGPVCVGSALNLTGGPAGMMIYSWTGPNGFTSLLQNPSISTNASIAMSGVYTLTAIYASGCTNTAITTVIVNALPLVNITSSGSPMCPIDSRTLTGSPADGTFIISDGPGTITGNVLTATGIGAINLEYSYTIVCTNKATQSIIVNENPVAIPGPDQELTFVFETQMEAELTQPETGEWSLISGSGHISDTHSPTTRVTELSTGENGFLWKVLNDNCEASAEVKITVHDLFVPSVITPDGDGKNDYFKISENIGKVDLVIFNRWGNEEYTNGDYKNDWDGRNNKGAELPYDTYFYVLKFENGKIKKGSVLIKR